MDANLVARELEMTLLAKLLEKSHVDASSNITMPAAALLHLLKSYLGPEISLNDLRLAANLSPQLSWVPYSYAIEVADCRSADGVCLTVFGWSKVAANRTPFAKLLAQHVERPRPPIAATSFKGGPLGLKAVPFEIRNEGYGVQTDVRVQDVTAPDWVAVTRRGNRITVSACPSQGGVYQGEIRIATNANAITLWVCAESAEFALPLRNELTLEELLPDHPDLNREATEALLERHLTGLKFERLPGGLFIRRDSSSPSGRSNEWWLTEADVLTGGLTAMGYPKTFTVYADADGKTDKYSEEVTAEYGLLGGGLADLFECLDVQPGQRLTLNPYQGGYKIALSPAQPWRAARGHTFWLQGPAQQVLEQQEVLEALLQRCDDKNITVNLLLCAAQEQALPKDLVRQHRAGRLTIRLTPAALPYRLIVCDEDASAYAPPFGAVQRPVAPPQAYWESAAPLGGRDYREQAWQRGKRGGESDVDGLLDLDLSLAMERLAQALRPLAQATASVGEAQRRRIQTELPGLVRQLGIRRKPVLAAVPLERYGISADQLNTHALGIRVTAGGYLAVRPQDVGSTRELARYIGNLYGAVIHHSQLRKLVEAFTGRSLEPTTFVMSSLQELGWGGNGYRRPRQEWEPLARELTPFAAEALAHFEHRHEALGWLRRNVAASEPQLERALTKAAVLAEELRKKKTIPQTPAPQVPAVVGGGTVPAAHEKGLSVPKSAAQAIAPVPKGSPAQGRLTRPVPVFAPLLDPHLSLLDPRGAAPTEVQVAVRSLIAAEGPLTESWLVRRYALHVKCHPRQIKDAVVGAVTQGVVRGEIRRLDLPGEHVEYLLPGQAVTLRARGTRNVEDIAFGEWCELLRSLDLTSKECDEAQAHQEAAKAYRFGTDAARVRPLLDLALSTLRGAPDPDRS